MLDDGDDGGDGDDGDGDDGDACCHYGDHCEGNCHEDDHGDKSNGWLMNDEWWMIDKIRQYKIGQIQKLKKQKKKQPIVAGSHREFQYLCLFETLGTQSNPML